MAGDSFEDRPDESPAGGTSLDVGNLLSNGFESLTSVTGAQLVAAVTVVGLLNSIFIEELSKQVLESALEVVRENADLSDPEVQEGLQEFENTIESFGFGLELSVPVLIAGLVVLALANEAVLIIGARSFAHDALDGIPTDLATRRLPVATLIGFVGGILLLIATAIGFALFVVPGLLIVVGTAFFRQEVAIADKGITGAISGTWQLTKGNRWTLFGVLILLFVIGSIAGLLTGIVPGTAGLIVSQAVTGVMAVFSLGAITDAYVRLRGGVEDPRELTDDAWS